MTPPGSPGQRGTNENTHRLLRQYFPDGTDISTFSLRQLDAVALRLNQRLRKTLAFETPAARLRQVHQHTPPASTSHVGEHVEVERLPQQFRPVHSRRPLLLRLLPGRCLKRHARFPRSCCLGELPR